MLRFPLSRRTRSTALTTFVSAVLFGLSGSLVFAVALAVAYTTVSLPIEVAARPIAIASTVDKSQLEQLHQFKDVARRMDDYGLLTDPFWGWRQHPWNQFAGFVKYGLIGSFSLGTVMSMVMSRTRFQRDAMQLGDDELCFDQLTQLPIRLILFLLAPLFGGGATASLVMLRVSSFALPGGTRGYHRDFIGLLTANLAAALLLATIIAVIVEPILRRRALVRLHRCISCGYPIRKGFPCSECGVLAR